MGFNQLGDIIPKNLNKTDIGRKISESFVLSKIPKLIARVLDIEIDDRLKPLYIKDGKLILACLDERLELVIREEENKLIQAISKELEGVRINKIQFVD